MTSGMVDKCLKEYLGTLDAEVRFDEPMSRHTYLGIGGPADIFIVPKSLEVLSAFLKAAGDGKIPVLPVGGGTNLLVSDSGIEGAVASMARFDQINEEGEDSGSVVLSVDAGCPLPRLVRFAADKGLKGMEGLVGIPGHVGGAVAGNAGAFGCEMKDVVVRVAAIDRAGNRAVLGRDEMGFAYRHAELPPGAIITAVELRLEKGDPAGISKRMEEFMRQKRASQPLGERSAGCVYKNPPGGFAGKLMEEAGCKGMRVGGIEVSRLHANFFVNAGGGTARDYMDLMVEVASKVRTASGVVLEPEIKMVGRC